MDKGIALKESDGLQAPPLSALSAETLDLIKKTVAQGATNEELRLFLFDCQRQGVHPLDKLIHFTKRAGRYTPITSIDFMRMRAADTGELAGNDDPIYTFLEDEEVVPKTATVTVHRLDKTGVPRRYTATARWTEYKPPAGQDHMWLKMPQLMLGKCAEALALRKAFPKQLHGLYERAEMAQAGREDEARVVNAPYAEPKGPRPIDVTHLPEARPEPSAETLFPTPDEMEERNALVLRGQAAIKNRKISQLSVRRMKQMFLGSEDGDVHTADLAALSSLVKHLESASETKA